MNQIQTKNDWYYETRPYFFGMIGLLSVLFASHAEGGWITVARICGGTLIFASLKIILWRSEYRRQT